MWEFAMSFWVCIQSKKQTKSQGFSSPILSLQKCMQAQMRFLFKPPLIILTTEFKAMFNIWEYFSCKKHKAIFKKYAKPGKLGNLLGMRHNIMMVGAANGLSAKGAFTEEQKCVIVVYSHELYWSYLYHINTRILRFQAATVKWKLDSPFILHVLQISDKEDGKKLPG